MRKICHGPSLYVILSKVTLYQFLEEVQATKSSQAIQDHIFPRSFSDISSRSSSSQIPIQGVGPRFLEKKNSQDYLSQNSFSKKFLSFVGNILSMGIQPLLSLVQVSQASLLSLKGLEHQMGYLSCPVKIGLSNFRNRMVQFLSF
jgi:hypothetical protein